MRVLFVSDGAGFSGAEIGLLTALRRLPPEVEPILACPPGELADRASQLGVEVVASPSVELTLLPGWAARVAGARSLLRSRRRLRRLARDRRIDVVHANSVRSGIAAVGARFPAGPPVVVSVHDCLPAGRRTAIARAVLTLGSTLLVYNSTYTRRTMTTRLGVADELVAYSPVRIDDFAAPEPVPGGFRRQLGLRDDEPLLGLVAQITPWKGQDHGIRTIATLKDRGKPVHLALVGSVRFADSVTRFDNAAFEQELHAMVADAGLEDLVHFVGEQDDVPAVMRDIDLLLLPSWEEPFGRVAVEAASAGRPVICGPHGGAREVVREAYGRVVALEDANAWADAVVELLDDPPASAERASAVTRLKRRFGVDPHVRALVRGWGFATPSGPAAASRRVLFVNHTARVSGAEQSLLSLLRALPDDVDATVMAPTGALVDELDRELVPRRRAFGTDASLKLDLVGTTSAVIRLVADAIHLRVRTRRGVIVQANTIRAGITTGIARCLGAPAPVVFLRDCLPPRLASRLVLWFIDRTAGTVVANSAYTAAHNSAISPLRNQTVIESIVDPEHFDPAKVDRDQARSALGLDPDAFVAGIVGQITPWKGHRVALAAVAAVPGLRLVVVGSTKFDAAATRYDNQAYAAELEGLIDTLGIRDRVLLLGERRDIPQVIRALDVVLMPSDVEPLGRVMLEAMSMGVPVLATDRGGPAEVLGDGAAGLVLSPDRPHDWRDALEALRNDPARRQAMGEAGRRIVVERFAPDVHLERLRRVWRENG